MAATSPDVGGEETTTLQLKHAQLTLGKDSLKIDGKFLLEHKCCPLSLPTRGDVVMQRPCCDASNLLGFS